MAIKQFIHVNDKLLSVEDLLHVTPVKSKQHYLATFRNCADPLWLTPDDYLLLSKKLNLAKPKLKQPDEPAPF